MINDLVIEVFGFGKNSPLSRERKELKTKRDLKKLEYGAPYSKSDIIHQHMTGDILPALNVFLAKKRKK